MRRFLVHILLSTALFFQGMGAVCAYGPMPMSMVKTAMTMHAMTDAGQGCMSSSMLPKIPTDHMPDQTCMQSCSLPANIHSTAFFVPHILLGEALSLPATVSLVDYAQVPPLPPPIA